MGSLSMTQRQRFRGKRTCEPPTPRHKPKGSCCCSISTVTIVFGAIAWKRARFKTPSVAAAISKGFVPVKVHAAKNPKLTEMFKVSKYPTDVIVTTDGKTLAHKVSPQQPDRYVAMLSEVESASKLAASPASTQPQAAKAPTVAAPATVPSPKVAAAPGVPSYATPGPTANGNAATMTAPQVAAVSPPPAPVNPTPAPSVATSTSKTSQFTMPSGKESGGTQAQMAAARSEGLSLAMPAPQQRTEPPSEAKPTPATQPDLAMQGYCPVTVIKEDRWVEGNPKLGVIHLGKLYLFSDADKMQTFLADPVPYTPVLNEIDVVRFFEERVIVPGKREWGLKDPTYNRMFFFADEAAMNHFWNEYERYTGAAIEVMEKAIKDANPGT